MNPEPVDSRIPWSVSLELLDASAAKRFAAPGFDQPLERIAYVFPEESAARAHLRALWLRGLELADWPSG